jgi:hypothetical protein
MFSMMKITYETKDPKQKHLAGWKCFWGKTVLGFDPTVHCMACLIGERFWPVHARRMPANVAIDADIPPGIPLYICGVAETWRWSDNFHLVVRHHPGGRVSMETWHGDTVHVTDAERLPIVAEDAASAHPNMGPKFLTCRNYQFGASFARMHPETVRASAAPQIDLDLR